MEAGGGSAHVDRIGAESMRWTHPNRRGLKRLAGPAISDAGEVVVHVEAVASSKRRSSFSRPRSAKRRRILLHVQTWTRSFSTYGRRQSRIAWAAVGFLVINKDRGCAGPEISLGVTLTPRTGKRSRGAWSAPVRAAVNTTARNHG